MKLKRRNGILLIAGAKHDLATRTSRQDLLREGKTDYFYADRAVHIQELVEDIYADAAK